MTPSEKIVFDLAKKSFLTLWSYANPKGKHGKELCDVLVYSEPHIIIISVKEIEPTNSGNLETDFKRWEKSALDKSFKQIYGAERYLGSVGNLKFCNGGIGPKLPAIKDRVYHRVAIVIGGEKTMPLKWGDMGKGFIHVFDSISTKVIMSELDTISDFIKYLAKKEEFYYSENFPKLLVEGGEEDLLAYYLSNSEEFLTEASLIVISEGLWEGYKDGEANRQWKEGIKKSYFWDDMIEYLTENYLQKQLEVGGNYEDFELVVRTMSKESRQSRIQLSQEFSDFMEKPELRARPVSSYSGIIYVYMSVNGNETRDGRRTELLHRCLILRKYSSGADTVIGIATEKKDGGKGFSLDVVYLYKPSLSIEDESLADELIKKYGYFKKSFSDK